MLRLAENCSPESIGSRFVIIDDEVPDAEARFTPEIPSAGKYDIYVTWGRSGNAYHVKFEVKAGSTKDVKYLDQCGWGGEVSVNASEWILIGTYDLPAGKDSYLSIQTAEATGKPSSENRVSAWVLRS